MNKNLLRLFSAFAFLISIALIGLFVLNMPQSPNAKVQIETEVDLTMFFADTSGLKLPENMYISSAKKFEGKYYIADAIAKKVYCIDENSNILWESQGEDKFILPNLKFPLDISEEGNLWVANTGKLRLEQLDINTGRFIASWQAKDRFKGCCNPVGLKALSGGRFLTMEKGVNYIRLLHPDGSAEVLEKIKGDWLKYEIGFYEGKIRYSDGISLRNITIPKD